MTKSVEAVNNRHNSEPHSKLAAAFNKDAARVGWHDETLWWVRAKRDKMAYQLPEWEALRQAASEIKSHTLANLGEYLVEFEQKAVENGLVVHWAVDADEHNRIVHGLLKGNGIDRIVKSKSMLTEECGLNEYLLKQGIDVIDTDLGERIVQLAGEAPSHIVLPCIHKKKEEIGDLFAEHLDTPKGCSDPKILTEAARQHLREAFLSRRAAITGVNFAIAQTGEFVVCTNEGNADMGAHLADLHIACMGIEKIIPRRKDLGIFLRLLARSATGQPITTYSSHFRKPDRERKIHIVIVDNGRSKQLAREQFRNSLKCIRCGACMNTCPVYRRSGGHSYHTAVAGPIGSILAPNLDMRQYADLPFASTLCGSCTHVCPVKIDIHDQLYRWRQVLVEKGYTTTSKTIVMKGMRTVLSSPMIYHTAAKAGRAILSNAPFLIGNRFNPWFQGREMPKPPKQSFGEWYRQNRAKDGE
ncbi:MAG: lactate utilization protein B [Saprospiraceae bacterium]|nr:lactate utilization protein [Saprospiraceae bacterium]MBX7180187.1 lactate utilization protein [Saprospiraceae bacterium]HMY85284.1 lactate utilization protein B [Saprospiraceae bacterium]HNF22669.1 lactate utilization protein B [Saprospiraceae bacterium]HNK10264.1 lactate utilization protein B [Saprospiraceae bacterium]